MSEKILPFFWDLASHKDSERFEAAEKLLSALSDSETSSDVLSSDLEYTLKRLVKGLASPRKAARQGFTETLIALLKRFNNVSLETVIELSKEHLQTSSNMKGHEESNVLFGQVMCAVVLIRSGRLMKKKVKNESLQFVLNQLLTCRGRKSYLREVCSTVLADLVAMVSSDVFMKKLFPVLKEELECGWEKCTADQLLILFEVHQHHSVAISPAFFDSHWGHTDFLGTQNFPQFVEVLVKAGSIHSPKVHSAWVILAKMLLADDKKFSTFWKSAVDTALLTSTLERRFAAFQLTEAILPHVSVRHLPVVLSAPLLKCVVKSLSSSEKYLHAAATHLCESLVQIFQKVAAESSANESAGDAAEQSLEGLVDVLLDLLWYPSRLLRRVVEEVFRGIVKHLTPGALDLIIAGVAGDDKDAEENGEDAEDDSDMQEESDLNDSDWDEGSDEDDDSDSGDDSEVEQMPLAKDVASEEEEEEETSEEEMPEDPKEIARVDTQLAQAFRLRVEMRTKQREERLNITHFRLRALDIIEIFIRRCQGSPLLVRLVLPLIEVSLQKGTDKQALALTEKARGLLKSRLCKARIRPISGAAALEDAYALLKRLVDMSAHAPTAALSALYTLAVMFVLRSLHSPSSAEDSTEQQAASPSSGDASRIVDTFAGPLEDYIKRKGSRLSPTLFAELARRHPAIGWRLARVMATHLPDSANEFRRKEVCSVLNSLMSRRDANQFAPLHLPGLSKQLRQALCACLKQAAEHADKVKPKNFRQLVALSQQFVRLSELCDSKLCKKNSSEITSAIDAAQKSRQLH